MRVRNRQRPRAGGENHLIDQEGNRREWPICMVHDACKFVRVCVCTLAIARLKVKKGRGRAGKDSDRVAKGRSEAKGEH